MRPANKGVPSNWSHDRTLFHLYLPRIVLGYIQLAVNLFFALVTVLSVSYFLFIVHRDIQIRIISHGQVISTSVKSCLNSFQENQCERVTSRLPAMQKLCSEWEICMSQSPRNVVTLQVFAEMVSESINKAVDPLSYKALGFITLVIVAFIYFNLQLGQKIPIAGAFEASQDRNLQPERQKLSCTDSFSQPIPQLNEPKDQKLLVNRVCKRPPEKELRLLAPPVPPHSTSLSTHETTFSTSSLRREGPKAQSRDGASTLNAAEKKTLHPILQHASEISIPSTIFDSMEVDNLPDISLDATMYEGPGKSLKPLYQ